LKPLSAIALTGGAILLVSLISKGQTLNRLVFYPERIRNVSFDGGATLNLGILVQNTSGNNLIINSFAGNMFINGTLAGNVSSFSPVAVNKNSQGVFIVNVKLFALGIVNQLIEAISSGTFGMTVTLEAYANVGGLQVPVNMTFKLGE
jgi:hypothetical protein